MHFHHQLFDYPPIDGIHRTGMMVVKISFCIRDGANVIHKADFKGDVKTIVSFKDKFAKADILEVLPDASTWDRA
jgi:hypothetical protein